MMMIAEKVDLSKYIEMRNDRPYIRGRKIPIMFLVSFQKANKASVDNLCYNYTLTEAQVLAALLYYLENKEQLDIQEELDKQEEKELFDRYARDNRK
ncbi:MAG TPA: DUF433 domain-containing protein [Aggregatilineales bacterium]|nr:DUF433 domain-containing protein [Aggregatilineales bacterium]